MSFTTLYRISFDLMLVFATLTLSVDVPDSPIALLFPVAVAVAAVVALLTVDRNPRLGLSRRTSNYLAFFSIGLVIVEWSSNPYLLLQALAHWLVYLQLVKMFLPKCVEDDWFLFLLGLMQVLVGAFGSQSDQVGMAMAVWALLALWVLSLFALHRESIRFRDDSEAMGESLPAEGDPYSGLLNLAFVISALRVTATTVALGGVIFLAMPRRTSMARGQTGISVPRHLTGFDEEVKLGQLGEILENDNVVMSIELYDDERNRIAPPPEPLWRGVTMMNYDNGRWHRQRIDVASFPSSTARRRTSRQIILQHIRLEPTDSPVLFGLRPMLDASSSMRSMPELNLIDGTLLRNDPRSETYDYRVLSDGDLTLPQPGEELPKARAMVLLVGVPDAIREPLRKIAEREVADIPTDFPLRRARKLEEYLRGSGTFGYSLHLGRTDLRIDPVLDFLANRKVGHCGYFASGLTLLLRSIGIPARMVNGFKGGDWNDIGQVLSVRQKHAHSWVEALIQTDPDHLPVWITFDPTPGAERNEAIASVGGFASNFRQITDLIRYIWVFYIVGYNTDRQHFLLYDPIQQLMVEARSGFKMMGEAMQSATTAVFGFHDFESFISVPRIHRLVRGPAGAGRPGARMSLDQRERGALVSRRS